MPDKALLVLGELLAEYLQLLVDFVEVSLKSFTILYKGSRKQKYSHRIFFGNFAQFLTRRELNFPPLLEA